MEECVATNKKLLLIQWIFCLYFRDGTVAESNISEEDVDEASLWCMMNALCVVLDQAESEVMTDRICHAVINLAHHSK